MVMRRSAGPLSKIVQPIPLAHNSPRQRSAREADRDSEAEAVIEGPNRPQGNDAEGEGQVGPQAPADDGPAQERRRDNCEAAEVRRRACMPFVADGMVEEIRSDGEPACERGEAERRGQRERKSEKDRRGSSTPGPLERPPPSLNRRIRPADDQVSHPD